jgi:hypothetical protein
MNPVIQSQWRCMRDKLAMVALSSEQDKAKWSLTKSGAFSVKSLYNKLSAVGVDRSFKQLWKAKIPLKIKIWLWLIWHNAIAAKDNMKKEIGLVVSFASFVLMMKVLLIYFLLVPWPLTCGVQSVQFLECSLGLLALPSTSGGLLKFFLLVLTFILLELQHYAGLFGKPEIMLALRENLFPLLLV